MGSTLPGDRLRIVMASIMTGEASSFRPFHCSCSDCPSTPSALQIGASSANRLAKRCVRGFIHSVSNMLLSKVGTVGVVGTKHPQPSSIRQCRSVVDATPAFGGRVSSHIPLALQLFGHDRLPKRAGRIGADRYIYISDVCTTYCGFNILKIALTNPIHLVKRQGYAAWSWWVLVPVAGAGRS